MSQTTLRLKVWTMVAMLALLGYAGTGLRAGEGGGSHSCKSKSCTKEASCDGAYYVSNGCKIQCYDTTGTEGQLEEAGSSDCGSPDLE